MARQQLDTIAEFARERSEAVENIQPSRLNGRCSVACIRSAAVSASAIDRSGIPPLCVVSGI